MKKFFLPFLCLLLISGGCNFIKKYFFKQPEIISIKNLSVNKFSLNDKVKLSMTMMVNNRNSIDAKITDSDFDVYINETYLGKGKLEVPVLLEADKVSEIKGEVITTYSNFMKTGINMLGTLFKSESVKYKANGTLDVSVTDYNIEVTVPFELESSLTISIQL